LAGDSIADAFFFTSEALKGLLFSTKKCGIAATYHALQAKDGRQSLKFITG
jgi:hypothetical protein